MAKKIKIENDLYEKLSACGRGAGYSSPEEFIIHILETTAAEVADAEDEEKVKERLMGLGYLG
ncbi:MAG TPA: hypothetical protein PK636_11045 [bacterium]|nr:hypothetical protein [bacterium]HPJ73212.1 hypothetical protein [bacterium]HPQ66268.1 hypothetical protein [bacterium]